jgi:hypothetical protein
MTKKINKPEVKEEVVEEQTTVVDLTPKVPLRQVELADFDIEILNAGQYGDQAWEAVGRRHKADPTTRQAIPGTNGRGFLMAPKAWPQVEPKTGVPVGTQNINFMNEFTGQPIHAGSNMAAVRTSLLSRDLTKPVSDETHEEEV